MDKINADFKEFITKVMKSNIPIVNNKQNDDKSLIPQKK